jgi:DDE superfamily endonuclease
MPNPLQHIEKHPDRSKDILGIEYEQWLTLVEVAKIEEEKIEELEMVKEMLTEYELIVDSWEQPRERPGDNETQKEYYSGKKRMRSGRVPRPWKRTKQKQHTFKGQVVTLPLGEDLVDVEVGRQGKTSDINIFREQQKKFNIEQRFTGDKGYQGGINIKTPQKKPRGKELTDLQKDANKEISSERIYVEHVIRLIKIFRAAKERFRMKGNKYEEVILTICGLVRVANRNLDFSSLKFTKKLIDTKNTKINQLASF